ncbi:MAG: ABC transporter permease [Gemmatimonadota bacterium]|jgi:putative ABC transport system permease protein
MSTGLTTLAEGIRIAIEALRANKLRSSLTILGVAVGVSVVVLMAALITGIRTSIMSGVESAGPKNFIVMRWDVTAVRIVNDGNDRPPWWNRPPLEPEEAERIAEQPAIEEALFNFGFQVTVDYGSDRVSGVGAQGYSAGWPRYADGDFVAGRDFIPAEVRASRAVVVITRALAEDLLGPIDPIGRRIGLTVPWRRTREEFTVIGVFEPAENIFTGATPHYAVVPYTAASKRLKVDDSQAQILVVPADSASQALAMDEVTEVMRATRRLGPREENDFSLLRSDQIIEIFDELTRVFFLIMLALSSAGLMVGGVGVIGIMLISVTERTREIGVRKAVGATRREILWQFLVEAGLMTLIGGAVGMALGAAGAEGVEAWTPLPAAIPMWAVAAALTMAVVTGMLFGLLPAYRASRLEPVDALRFE